MALAIKHLNGDASFLLSFEPLVPHYYTGPTPKPFHILLDPWITGPSTTFHRRISVTTHKERACISSLLDLPEPDLVIISQDKTDHLNEATLRQLPRTGAKTVILAEQAAARIIRSWKYFEKDKVITIPKWEDPRLTGRQTVIRIPVPPFPLSKAGDPGEVTVAFIPQRRDLSGLHSAIGITYRPPTVPPPPPVLAFRDGGVITPPETPKSRGSHPHLRVTFMAGQPAGHPVHPVSPTSLRSVRSAMSLSTSRHSYHSATSQISFDRPLSVLYSPHGISYSSLHGYVTSHLISEAALPLTALLHCFDSVTNPWWLGGKILLGAPAGVETATKLEAKAWISAHDGAKDIRGVFTSFLRTTKFRREEVLGRMALPEAVTNKDKPLAQTPGSPTTSMTSRSSTKSHQFTEVLSLAIGEEAVFTSDGIWAAEEPAMVQQLGMKRNQNESWLDLTDEPETEPETGIKSEIMPEKNSPLVSAGTAPVLPVAKLDTSSGFANLEEVLRTCRDD